MSRIKQLSLQLANQISAGEVVERPSSVVKELVENALDAGATQVDIYIENGGAQLIQIRDNGEGIEKEDLPLSIARHATSKIESVEDLFSIASLGFRGEALASIASVSRFSLSSKSVNADIAYQLSIEGESGELIITPAPHPNGTTVTVRELFFNTPVRRKFLKGEKTEFQQIEQLVYRLVLSRNSVGFSLHHNGKTLLQLPPAKTPDQQLSRIQKLFGKQFIDASHSIDIETENMHFFGWICDETFMRSSNDLQFFYLNGRSIKDKLINHAIRQAYEEVLFEGRAPAYVLFLECDPHSVDVNVHPTKNEVRFQDSRTVHDFIARSIARELHRHQAEKANQYTPSNNSTVIGHDANRVSVQDPDLFSFNDVSSVIESPLLTQDHGDIHPVESAELMNRALSLVSDELPSHAHKNDTEGVDYPTRPVESRYAIMNSSSGGASGAVSSSHHRDISFDDFGRIMTKIGHAYILTEQESQLFIISLKHAQQEIFYRELISPARLHPRPLLVPLTFKIETDHMRYFNEVASLLSPLHFDIELLTEHSIAVRSIPTVFNQVDLQYCIIHFFAWFAATRTKPETLPGNNHALGVYVALAQSAAARMQWNSHQVVQLCRDLIRCDKPQKTMDGLSIWRPLATSDFARLL